MPALCVGRWARGQAMVKRANAFLQRQRGTNSSVALSVPKQRELSLIISITWRRERALIARMRKIRDLRFSWPRLIAQLANQLGLSPVLLHVGIGVLVNGSSRATAMSGALTVSARRQSHCVPRTRCARHTMDHISRNSVIQHNTPPGRNHPLLAHISSYSSAGRALDYAISCSPENHLHSVHSRNVQSPGHDDFSIRICIIRFSKPKADI